MGMMMSQGRSKEETSNNHKLGRDEMENSQTSAMLRQTLEQGGIKTLSDFVDQESINEVVTRATISFQQLKVRSTQLSHLSQIIRERLHEVIESVL